MRWGAVVAAGGEAEPSLAEAIGARAKALARFGDAASVELVLAAVRAAGIGPCATVGGPDVRSLVAHGEWIPEVEGGSAIDNVIAGAAALGEVEAVLLLPADAPALEAAALRAFMEFASRARGEVWYAAGLADASAFRARYPEIPASTIRLREGRFVSGALYAASPAGLLQGQELFRHARRNRRSQAAMVARFGLHNLALYGVGAMSLSRAERALARTLGGAAHIDPTADPATCLDFDDAAEYLALRRILAR